MQPVGGHISYAAAVTSSQLRSVNNPYHRHRVSAFIFTDDDFSMFCDDGSHSTTCLRKLRNWSICGGDLLREHWALKYTSHSSMLLASRACIYKTPPCTGASTSQPTYPPSVLRKQTILVANRQATPEPRNRARKPPESSDQPRIGFNNEDVQRSAPARQHLSRRG